MDWNVASFFIREASMSEFEMHLQLISTSFLHHDLHPSRPFFLPHSYLRYTLSIDEAGPRISDHDFPS
jgi:hypothetical protein